MKCHQLRTDRSNMAKKKALSDPASTREHIGSRIPVWTSSDVAMSRGCAPQSDVKDLRFHPETASI
jgi:hypothetical protein